jgi:hypothetical protein
MYAPVLFLAYILHKLYCANVKFGHLCFATWYFPKALSFASLVAGIHAFAHSAAVVVVTIPSAANSRVKCFQMAQTSVKNATRALLMCGRSGINA